MPKTGKRLYRRRWPSTMQAALYWNRRRRGGLLDDGTPSGPSYEFIGPLWALRTADIGDLTSQIIWDDSNTWRDDRIWEENF